MTTTGDLDPAELLAQEERLTLAGFTDDDAVDLGLLVTARARERALPVTLEIRRDGRAVYRAALTGSTPDQDGWIARKARVVERFGHATMYERVRHEAVGTTFEAATGLPEAEYAAHGGGFPLRVRNEGLVGVLLVSGLPQVDDHAFAVACLEEFLAR
jgi:uncharacterized protein (UPF0303 family)